MRKRHGIRRNTKKRLIKHWIARHGSLICFYCSCLTLQNVPDGNPLKTTADHFIPKSKGGTDNRDNLVIACSRCNNKKDNKLPI